MGDGSCIKFWRDPWCEGLPLKNIFLELYNIASNKDASVAELLFPVANYHWNIRFTQPVQDWELELVASFMDCIYSGSWRRNGVDKICWTLSTRGVFDVLSYYKALQPPNPDSFPWKLLWKPKVPPKVSFLFGQRLWEKFLTIDNLRSRKVVVVDWCCMCKRNGVITDHLLLHCPVSQELWNTVCSLFGVHWVMPRGVVELLASWSNKFNRLKSKVLWRRTPHCLMWVIWRERNTHTFDGNERSIHELKLLFFQTLFYWANATGVFTFISLPDMLDFCTFIVT